MQYFLMVLSAIIPVVVLLWYIYRKDSVQPEPAKWLLKAFGFGIITTLLSLVFSVPVSLLFGMDIDARTYSSVSKAFVDAFVLAAIPEELAKFIMLWLLLRKNPFFDEHFDGIVYAVCVGMGFAALENVLYLFQNYDSWISVGIVRALFAVPGHFFFAIIMGYYYSLWHFRIKRDRNTFIMIILAPILAHGIYDGILFSMNIDESLSVIILIFFLVFFNKLKNVGKKHITELMNH